MIWDYFKTKTTNEQPNAPKATVLSRLKQGLGKTRARFLGLFRQLFNLRRLDDDTREQLLDLLIASDVGPDTSETIVQDLTKRYVRDDSQTIYEHLHQTLCERLEPVSLPPYLPTSSPEVVMLVGVNGAGKTTTVGRLAHYFKQHDRSVYLAAGDTFRAAATEQLDTWAQRNDIPITSQGSGADSASVVFDAYQASKKQGLDVLLADTAGRLHNKEPLMQELAKVSRVLSKLDADAPHETWLVLDACVGQNGLVQARKFHEHLGLTGVVVTKLDGSAKGGIIFAIAHELKLPIRFLGVGEAIGDLSVFDAKTFVDAFLDTSA